MKKITFSLNFQKKLRVIKRKNPNLLQKIKKQLQLFKENPKHPSLRIHKLEGKLKNTWSLSVGMSVRILFIEDAQYYFFDIGTHSQVYKK